MDFINVITQETNIPSQIGGTYNITWENSQEMLKSMGWRIKPELPVIAEGHERLSIDYVDGDGIYATAVYADTLIQDRLNAELAAAQAAHEALLAQMALANAERQINKVLELKQTENAFLTICEQLTGSKTKLGFANLQTIIESLMTSDPNSAIVLSIRLLTINSAGLRLGGLLWWDDIIWHEDIV